MGNSHNQLPITNYQLPITHMNLTLFIQQILNGLSIGTVYAIFALGYTLIFSILGIINFAHGAIFTLGAYFTYTLIGGRFGFSGLLANAALPVQLPFALALILGSALAGLVGIAIERIAFRPLRRKGSDPLLTVVSSLGVALVIVNLIQYLVGAENYTFPGDTYGNLPAAINFGTAENPIPIRTVQLVIFGVSVAIFAILTYFINYTKYGKAMRAVAEDATTASLLGINTSWLVTEPNRRPSTPAFWVSLTVAAATFSPRAWASASLASISWFERFSCYCFRRFGEYSRCSVGGFGNWNC